MNYNEFLEKLNLDKEEVLKQDTLFRKEAEDFKISADNLEKYLMQRWNVYLSKANMSYSNLKKVVVKGVFFGVKSTDFGAGNMYDKAIKAYQQNPEQAISDGVVDEYGEPIYTKPKFRLGKKIDVNDVTYQAYGAFKLEGEDFKLGMLSFKQKLDIPTGKLVKFEAGLKTTDNGLTELSATRLTKINVTQNLTTKDFQELLNNYFKNDVMNVKQAMEEAKNLASSEAPIDFNKLYFVKGHLGSNGVNILDEGKTSDVLTLLHVSETADELLSLAQGEGKVHALTVWLDKDNKTIPRNIDANAMDLFIVTNGLSYKIDDNGNERYSTNAIGVMVDDKYLIEQDAEEVTPTVKVEQADESQFA